MDFVLYLYLSEVSGSWNYIQENKVKMKCKCILSKLLKELIYFAILPKEDISL